MKSMIVLPVLKYLSSNPVTLLQKNVNILKQFLISFALIFIKIWEGKDTVPLLHVVNKQFSL